MKTSFFLYIEKSNSINTKLSSLTLYYQSKISEDFPFLRMVFLRSERMSDHRPGHISAI